MDYLIAFLEGIITFVSPCLLPLLPVYLSYFAGQDLESNKRTAAVNALGFVSGFTIVFVLLGAFAGAVGGLLRQYSTVVNIVLGVIVILFGLNFMEIIRLPGINTTRQHNFKSHKPGFISSFLFGMVFSVGWTPCVGAFLGSALMLAASGGQTAKGILMLLVYSLGLGIPFIVSALLIGKLKGAFAFIKRHYRVVNLVSGGLLVIVGILMATGLMGRLLNLLSL
ncbi:MAG TPA: cytochrome C biogenesis protein ResB [Clostridiales bacterium]|nr:cytochrome C biogenesis protein ResB [Clostridiales bacterium]